MPRVVLALVHVEDRKACAGRGLRQKGAGDRKDRRRIGVLAKARGEPTRRAWAARSGEERRQWKLATAIDGCCGERRLNNNLWKIVYKIIEA